MSNPAKLKIGEFLLDPSRNLLTGPEGEATLEPKVVDVLVALAVQPGEVLSRDELIDTVWKAEFGADERLTRAISQLRKAFHDERGAARYIETVAKRGYRLVAPVARVTETNGTTPAGEDMDSAHSIPPTTEAAPPRPAPGPPPRTWRAYATAAALLLTLTAVVAGVIAWRDSDSRYATDLVELRAFSVTAGQPDLKAFAEQTQVSLKRILSSNQVLVVDAAAGGSPAPAANSASEFILAGSVESTSDAFAVTLFFDKRADGQTLWSHRFARPVAGAEGLREEIGVNTAFIIECALKERRAARVKPSVEAFKVYLESCDPVQVWGNPLRKLHLAQRLIKLAPNDAYGHGLEALTTAWLADDEPEITEAQAEAFKAAAHKASARALELDPGNSLALVAELLLAPQAERWQKQEALLKRGSLDHTAARGLYFGALRAQGRLKEAAHVARANVAATTLLPNPRMCHAVVHMQLGAHEEAERLFEAALRLWPDNDDLQFYRFVNRAFYREPDEALKLLHGLRRDRKSKACYRTFIEARRHGGNASAALRRNCATAHWSHQQYLARMLAALGDTDGAYEAVRNTPFDRPGSTVFLFYPEMAQFRRDLRFMPFIAGSGLLDAWAASEQWPDFCTDKTLPYDCKAAAARALQAKVSSKNGTTARN